MEKKRPGLAHNLYSEKDQEAFEWGNLMIWRLDRPGRQGPDASALGQLSALQEACS